MVHMLKSGTGHNFLLKYLLSPSRNLRSWVGVLRKSPTSIAGGGPPMTPQKWGSRRHYPSRRSLRKRRVLMETSVGNYARRRRQRSTQRRPSLRQKQKGSKSISETFCERQQVPRRKGSRLGQLLRVTSVAVSRDDPHR